MNANVSWPKLELGISVKDSMSRGVDFKNLGHIILAGFIFGTIGWGANSYGKRLGLWQPRVIGWTMMLYPYVVFNLWLLWGIGVGLLTLLWFFHHE